MMELSTQQSEALALAKDWFDNRSSFEQVFRVFGYAGTGKSTIAREFARLVPGKVEFASYTGKAAHVLRSKGCNAAVTIHSLIYLPKNKSAERLRELQDEYIKQTDLGSSADVLMNLRNQIKIEQENFTRPLFAINSDSNLRTASLLIVDEVSMVNDEMGRDLLSFERPILVLGDPAQLPPVMGGGYFTNCDPDVLLTEVHRHAAGSPVLALATRVREGRGLGDTDLVVPKGRLGIADLAAVEQVLVGTNHSRQVINRKMREHLGYVGPMPVIGDRLICTRNDGDTGLLNGSQWFVRDVLFDADQDYLNLTIQSVDNEQTYLNVTAHPQPFRGEDVPYFLVRERQCFEYAYAMTVHKAQGSQFDSVVLVDESSRFPAQQRRAWLYTGITRAANHITVIK